MGRSKILLSPHTEWTRQSYTSRVHSGGALWRVILNICPLSVAWPSPGRLWANMTSSTNRKYITYSIVVRRLYWSTRVEVEVIRATAMGIGITSKENFAKLGRVVLEICERTDRQTDRHTNTLITIHPCRRRSNKMRTHCSNAQGTGSVRWTNVTAARRASYVCSVILIK